MSNRKILAGTMLCIAAAALPASAQVWYVDDSASGAANGSSWADAFSELQAALAAATAGEEVWVAAGIYTPDYDVGSGTHTGQREAAFDVPFGVAVYGGFAGTESERAERAELFDDTLLSGDLAGGGDGENSYHVVVMSGVDDSSVLDGFTITGGNADGRFPDFNGGGLLSSSSDARVANCRFVDNAADFGGGAFLSSGLPTFESCIFIGNGARMEGGGAFIEGSDPLIRRSRFVGNTAVLDGGGVYNVFSCPVLTDSVVVGNVAGFSGAAVFNSFSDPQVINSTIVANHAALETGGVYNASSTPTLVNSVLWGNSDADGLNFDEFAQLLDANAESATLVHHCLIQGLDTFASCAGCSDNFDADPLLVNIDGADGIDGTGDENLRLLEGSPCVDSGDDAAVGESVDFDGQPRIVGDAVDLGAYEFQGQQPCRTPLDCADLDGDGIRDDGCVWWDCQKGQCADTETIFGDLGGTFLSCPPDIVADGNDHFHALNCFTNTNLGGVPGYPCELTPPFTVNVDAGGLFGDCDPDGVCDANDAFLALNAFAALTTCSCPLDGGPMPQAPRPPQRVGAVALELRAASAVLRPGELLEVEASLAGPFKDLRGYQLHAAVRGGLAGTLELVDIVIEARRDHVFSRREPWRAFNVATGQMVAGLYGAGTAVPARRRYLATFSYRASPDARGSFVVDLLHDHTDAAQRTYLFPSAARGMIEVRGVAPARIRVIGPAWR